MREEGLVDNIAPLVIDPQMEGPVGAANLQPTAQKCRPCCALGPLFVPANTTLM
jgi:hypothetical protein